MFKCKVGLIAQRRADWGVTIEPVARDAGLRFRPLQGEAYDFVVPAARWDRPAVTLLRGLLDDPGSSLRSALAEAGYETTLGR